tara:strand:+ start:121 stop:387 length:267 start_codon:yes stop_codon:yes gene_type:complete
MQQQPNVDLSTSTAYTCDKCEHDTFKTVFKLRQISAIASPSGEEMLVPIQAFACVHCGHINKEFLPKDLPDNEDDGFSDGVGEGILLG